MIDSENVILHYPVGTFTVVQAGTLKIMPFTLFTGKFSIQESSKSRIVYLLVGDSDTKDLNWAI